VTGRQIKKKEKWATDVTIGSHVEVGSRMTVVKNSQKPVQMSYTYIAPVKGKSLGIVDFVVKRWNCTWLHQEAIDLKG
jgi:hypothetical protein